LEDGENMTIPLGEKKFWKRAALASATLVGLLAFAATPRVYADDYDRCQRRIAKADHKLHEAAEHHGWNSRQADHARHELREARERCWNERHRWWDEDGRRWHNDRDWDDHDHDRH
jgi:dienelactone hydrolase